MSVGPSLPVSTAAGILSGWRGAVDPAPSPSSDRVGRPASGALAFVPFEPPGAAADLLSGFRAVAQKRGPIAAIQWLVGHSGPLQNLLKTPVGRIALAVAALGFTSGWAVGTNASKVQAVATALKGIADQRLPADQAARQVGAVLKAAVSAGNGSTPKAQQRKNAQWPVASRPDNLAQARDRLARAKAALKESQAVLWQNPANPGQSEIVQARQANVDKIQVQVDALSRAGKPTRRSSDPSIRQPDPPKRPKEIDHGPGGADKARDRMGDVMREQRVEDYRAGRTTRDGATRGLGATERTRVRSALDDIDRSRLPPGGVTGGRSSGAASLDASPTGVESTRAPRRSKAQRLRDLGRKTLAERFDGTNVTMRLVMRVRRKGGFVDVATPARDGDRLTARGPATVGDVKRLLGGLNKSVVSIREGLGGLINVTVDSKSFNTINIKLIVSARGIDSIEIGEISSAGRRTPQRDAFTNAPMPDLDTTRQPLIGALLALKIVQAAEAGGVRAVSAFAAATAPDAAGATQLFQGARVWPQGGFDGPIGPENVARVRAFLKANPAVATRVGLQVVTEKTRVLDFLADSKGNLVPESMDFWHGASSGYRGTVDLSDKSSRSYRLFQRALADFGLK